VTSSNRHAPVDSRALSVAIHTDVGPDRERCEQELLDAGVPLPLPHRSVWARSMCPRGSWFVAVRRPDGRCVWGFAVELQRSRALPGHLLARAERLTWAGGHAAFEAGLGTLAQVARSTRTMLRISLELFSPDPNLLGQMGATAAQLGFRRRLPQRCYAETLIVDLRPSEEEMLKSFHGTARRHIRSAGKHPVEVRPIVDPRYAGRLDELLRETLARTGGTPQRHDWDRILDFSHSEPTLSRVVGLFRADTEDDPSSLLAFAWGCNHGDHAHYSTAASTRASEIRLPMGYVLAWDLMTWAKRHGAQWFDFGGITRGSFGGTDPVGGISDFKRYFSTTVASVGEEWILEPHRIRSLIANAASALVRTRLVKKHR